jgi:hypothetical protein
MADPVLKSPAEKIFSVFHFVVGFVFFCFYAYIVKEAFHELWHYLGGYGRGGRLACGLSILFPFIGCLCLMFPKILTGLFSQMTPCPLDNRTEGKFIVSGYIILFLSFFIYRDIIPDVMRDFLGSHGFRLAPEKDYPL